MKKILLILASSRQGRKGELIAKWAKNYIKKTKHPGLQFDFADLKEIDLPFFDSAIPPLMGKYPEGKISNWAKKIASFDGFLVITPEYNHGYPAILKNAIDVIYKEWNYKPITFISYGGVSGGIRAVEQLRQVVIEMKMIPLKEEVSIPFVWSAFDEKGDLINPTHYENSLQSVLNAFSHYFTK